MQKSKWLILILFSWGVACTHTPNVLELPQMANGLILKDEQKSGWQLYEHLAIRGDIIQTVYNLDSVRNDSTQNLVALCFGRGNDKIRGLEITGNFDDLNGNGNWNEEVNGDLGLFSERSGSRIYTKSIVGDTLTLSRISDINSFTYSFKLFRTNTKHCGF